jgi:hypothetical protein
VDLRERPNRHARGPVVSCGDGAARQGSVPVTCVTSIKRGNVWRPDPCWSPLDRVSHCTLTWPHIGLKTIHWIFEMLGGIFLKFEWLSLIEHVHSCVHHCLC